MKVIETNLFLDATTNEIKSFQSRVIEIDSWESLIDEFKTGEDVIRTSCIGTMWGSTLPRTCTISNLQFDEDTISCDLENIMGKYKKLMYHINEK